MTTKEKCLRDDGQLPRTAHLDHPACVPHSPCVATGRQGHLELVHHLHSALVVRCHHRHLHRLLHDKTLHVGRRPGKLYDAPQVMVPRLCRAQGPLSGSDLPASSVHPNDGHVHYPHPDVGPPSGACRRHFRKPATAAISHTELHLFADMQERLTEDLIK